MAKTILLYGRSRAGKSAQLGELAKHVKKTTGKNTRIYHIDKGGYDVLNGHIDLGFVEIIEQKDTDPWLFASKATSGQVRNDNGQWVKGDLSNIGLVAFEGITAFCDAWMLDLAEQAAKGVNIGGQASTSFRVQSDGETLTIGGNNMSHYNIVQNRITKEVWNSQRLNAPYIVWTASATKDDDSINSGKVLGPASAGKALTAEIPRWFNYTFRIDAVPAQQGKPERHILYLGLSTDTTAGNAISLGNTRVPMGVELPASIEPANLVQALTLIEEATGKAKEAMKRELGLVK